MSGGTGPDTDSTKVDEQVVKVVPTASYHYYVKWFRARKRLVRRHQSPLCRGLCKAVPVQNLYARRRARRTRCDQRALQELIAKIN